MYRRSRFGLILTLTLFRRIFVEIAGFLRRVTNHVRSELIYVSFDRTTAVILEFQIYGGDGISEWYEIYYLFRESRERISVD